MAYRCKKHGKPWGNCDCGIDMILGKMEDMEPLK